MKNLFWTILIVGVFLFAANHYMKMMGMSLWIFPV